MWRCVVAVLLLTSCGAPSAAQVQATVDAAVAATAAAIPPTPDPCGAEAITAYGAQAKPLLDTYFAQLGIAQSTPRVSLGPVLQGLFDAEQKIIALTPPPCLVDWHGRTKNMMDLYRTGMNQFAAQNESDSTVNMVQATALREVIEPALGDIVTGKVPVLP